MASETTRMFRAVVVVGVSLTACSGASTTGAQDEPAKQPAVNVDTSTVARPTDEVKQEPGAGKAGDPLAGDPGKAGDPLAGDPGKAGDPLAGDAGKAGDPLAGDAAKTGDPLAGDAAKPGDPLADAAETKPKKSRRSAADRKREAEERKRREWEAKFPHIL